MPHQCVRCSRMYDDGAKEILEGCPCGAKLFFFIKKEKLEKMRQQDQELQLDEKEKGQIESDIYDLIGDEIDTNKPVILDLEAIRVLKPGKYEVDLVHLFKEEPLIFRLEDGKYVVDLKKSFKGKGEAEEQ